MKQFTGPFDMGISRIMVGVAEAAQRQLAEEIEDLVFPDKDENPHQAVVDTHFIVQRILNHPLFPPSPPSPVALLHAIPVYDPTSTLSPELASEFRVRKKLHPEVTLSTLCSQILQPVTPPSIETVIKTEVLSTIDHEVIFIDLDKPWDLLHSAGDILELTSPPSPISSVDSDGTVIEQPLQD